MSVGAYSQASGPRAGFGQRLGAALIDGMLVVAVVYILTGFFGQVGYLVGLITAVPYFTYFEGGRTGQTLGKRVLGVRVVDFATGTPIGYGRGLIRYLARAASSLVLYLGYFWMLWDREAQTWHDKLASTVVVPISAYPLGYSAAESSAGSRY
jgi:uncharacterized RDD family membrane protein YckC